MNKSVSRCFGAAAALSGVIFLPAAAGWRGRPEPLRGAALRGRGEPGRQSPGAASPRSGRGARGAGRWALGWDEALGRRATPRRTAPPAAFAPRAGSARAGRLTPAAATPPGAGSLLGHRGRTNRIRECRLWAPGGARLPGHPRRPRGPAAASPRQAARPHRCGCWSRPVFFSSGGQLVSQMRALRCQGGFVTAPRAGPAALSCPPPPREPIVPGPSGGCWRQIYRGRRPAGRGLRSAAGRGAGGSAPGTFDPSCCHRRGRRRPRGRIPLGICFARPVRGRLPFFFFS